MGNERKGEFVEIIGDMVLQRIIPEIKDAKYFGIIVDSTPDLTHVDQLTFILRYVNVDELIRVERFLQFIPISSHTGKSLSVVIWQFLSKIGVDIRNCLCQSFFWLPVSPREYETQHKMEKANLLVDKYHLDLESQLGNELTSTSMHVYRTCRRNQLPR